MENNKNVAINNMNENEEVQMVEIKKEGVFAKIFRPVKKAGMKIEETRKGFEEKHPVAYKVVKVTVCAGGYVGLAVVGCVLGDKLVKRLDAAQGIPDGIGENMHVFVDDTPGAIEQIAEDLDIPTVDDSLVEGIADAVGDAVEVVADAVDAI